MKYFPLNLGVFIKKKSGGVYDTLEDKIVARIRVEKTKIIRIDPLKNYKEIKKYGLGDIQAV